MNSIGLITGGVMIGFLIGAISAFLLGKKFLRKESRKLYYRWRRRLKHKHQATILNLAHDLKNPLFVIQSFTWSYLDHADREKCDPGETQKSTRHMTETLNRQAEKALNVVEEAVQIELDENSSPMTEVWREVTSRSEIQECLSKSQIEVDIPGDFVIPRKKIQVREGLEDFLYILFEDKPVSTAKISFHPQEKTCDVKFIFNAHPPSPKQFEEAKSSLEDWTKSSGFIQDQDRVKGVEFSWRV